MADDFKKKLIINIIIIIVIFAASFFILKYFNNMISAKTQEIEEYRKNNALFIKYLSNLAQLKKVESQAELYQSKLFFILPKKDELIDAPLLINNTARASQVNVNFNFIPGGKDSTGDSPGFENFTIEITGSLSNIEKFLYNIETMSPKFIFNIDNFNISNIEENYQFSGSGKVFFKN